MKHTAYAGPTRALLALALCALTLLLAACDLGSSSQPSPSATLAATAQVALPATPTAQSILPQSPVEQATAVRTEVPPTAVPPTQPPAAATAVPPTPPPPAPTATNAPVATATPVRTRSGQVETIATGFGSPDDLTISPSGDILFGDFGNGAINIIKANAPAGSRPSVVASGLKDPEGLLVMQDGTIIVAEQKTNRILAIDPATGKSTLLRQLVNDTGQDGVDGLGLDPATGDILIPDSPYGRLLRMSRDGKSLSVVATGFVRPTGVAVEQRGTMVVADEFGNAVYRLQADGSHRTKIASIFQPDDVVLGPDGGIFVNSLGGDIVRIDPSTGAKRVLLSGLNLPHGIWVDSSGRVVVAEAGRNRILSITP